MRKCPNCSRPTKRTEDWACQWCGYPLVSKSYQKVPKTFRQLKEERLQEQRQKSRLSEDTTTTIEDIVTTTEDAETTKIELTAEEIYSVCTADKTAAATKFKNKTLIVTGIVANVVADDGNDIYYLSLSGLPRKEECYVNCMFDKKNSSEFNLLTEGQTVTVEGKYDDYELNILIKDCVLVGLPEREETPTALLSSDITSAPTATQASEPETVAEPAAEPAEPGLPPEQEPVAEMEAEPVTEPEPVAEVEPEPAPEPEPVAEAAEPELTSEQETAAETEAEPVIEPEPVAEVEPEPTPEPEPTVPAIEVTVDELLSAYASDEAAASERYGNKLLKVTGVVNRIEIQDYLEFDYINLANIENNRFEHVRCFFKKEHAPELNQLTKGQKITVQGMFAGSIVSMYLRDCSLVS